MEVRRKLLGRIRNYLLKYPYRVGMPKAQLHTGLMKKVKINVFLQYIDYLTETGILKSYNDLISEADYEVVKDDTYNQVRRALLGGIKPAKYDFIKITDINFKNIPSETVEDILTYLVSEGEIVKMADNIYTLKKYMDKAKDMISQRLVENGKITISEVRDMFNTSRKSAKPIVEYMDRIKITKQCGKESERASNLS